VCFAQDAGFTTLALTVGSSTNADVNFGFIKREGHGDQNDFINPKAGGYGIPAGGEVALNDISLGTAAGTPIVRAEGQLIYHNAKRVITVNMHAVAN
jgi:hypothetical protein